MMADVATTSHPLWETILRFVTTGSDLGSPAQVTYTLTARKYGAGNGTITSNNPSEINCNVSCSFTYVEGTSVSLTATPANGSTFVGWLGDCSGMGPCSVRMEQSRTVRAAFNLVSPPSPSGVPPYTVTLFTGGLYIIGITSGPDGNLWFATQGNRIGRITPAGVIAEFSAGISANAYPYGITAGPDGNIWFTIFTGPGFSNQIGRVTLK